ncbi:MAG: hypothetical protein V4735_00285 [Pseudomonadota bacterium]
MTKPTTTVTVHKPTLGQRAASQGGLMGLMLAVTENGGPDKPDWLESITTLHLIQDNLAKYLATPTEEHPGSLLGEFPKNGKRSYGNQPGNYDIINSATMVLKHMENNKQLEAVREQQNLLGIIASSKGYAEDSTEYANVQEAISQFVTRVKEHNAQMAKLNR